MFSGSTTTAGPLAGAGLLAAARAARAAADAAETEVLRAAVAWAHLHPADGEEACTILSERGEDTGLTIAGEGAPAVSEFAVIELATALGLCDAAGRALVGQALELAHRLPRVWARVLAGDLAPWRARRIAEATTVLSAEAAGYVDVNVAPFAHKIGPAATLRLVEEAIARHMPEYAEQRRQAAAEHRHFTIEHHQVSFEGTSQVHGELDLADALDLEAAVAAGAAGLAALGSSDPLDVRRATAVGEIARSQLAHDAVTGAAGVQLGRLENRGPHLLTADTIREWLAAPGTTVRVQPVLDLNETMSATSHELPARMREQATLRDGTCTFPHCTRPARSCDDEHAVPFDAGGATTSSNTAKVCRKHHRAKTHGGWRYRIIRPGTYAWTSPHGYRYLRDPSGTVDLNPPAVPPPRPLDEWDDLPDPPDE